MSWRNPRAAGVFLSFLAGSLIAGVLVAHVLIAGAEETLKQDFSGKDPGKDWKASPAAWKVEKGELRGAGAGYLECTRPISGDFLLTFEAQTEEKSNVEVRLLDKSGQTLFTFAFLGRYHSVLDGPKSAILKGDQFVSVSSRMWIFPGRTFAFKVRREGKQYQMFLNKDPGPVFVDDTPAAGTEELRIRIDVAPEGKTDGVRIDNVALTWGGG